MDERSLGIKVSSEALNSLVQIGFPFIFLTCRTRFSQRLMVKKNECNIKSYEVIEVLYMYDIINLALQLSVTKHLMWHILLW